ncbi:hypothetical protein AYI68_g6351 [Smittium mucronatum]|uniref:Uncharacterized protein n=1 Tax=Smittium mucronatum TaxID=133383 RepID=A0A1R0GRS1_9FUNG|nr:hypothetical protein AYI68_g6351 [Smittium mucronatum]
MDSVLMPIGCYGCENFGIVEARVKPIQAKIDKAIRIIANVGKSATMKRLPFNTGMTSWLTCSARWIKKICVQNLKGEQKLP